MTWGLYSTGGTSVRGEEKPVKGTCSILGTSIRSLQPVEIA